MGETKKKKMEQKSTDNSLGTEIGKYFTLCGPNRLSTPQSCPRCKSRSVALFQETFNYRKQAASRSQFAHPWDEVREEKPWAQRNHGFVGLLGPHRKKKKMEKPGLSSYQAPIKFKGKVLRQRPVWCVCHVTRNLEGRSKMDERLYASLPTWYLQRVFCSPCPVSIL